MSSGISRHPWGRTPAGEPVDLLELRSATGLVVHVATLGGIITSVLVPDRSGAVDDVVLGHSHLGGYIPNPPYLGAVIGRYANRIARGTFTLDGVTRTLACNEGPHHLHGGPRGWDQAVWHAEPFVDGSRVGVRLTHASPDGDQGYPGSVNAQVTYAIGDGNALHVEYRAVSDRPTIVNLTQHTYFNLAGRRASHVLDHELTIHASRFTPIDEAGLPYGDLAAVANTPFDFREARRIGDRIGDDDAQLAHGRGYDHNFVLDSRGNGLSQAARLVDPLTRRTLDVWTTKPGLQLYSGNRLDGTIVGKDDRAYGPHAGVCLETQHFPDSPNRPDFPSTVLRPGEEYRSATMFVFGVE